jgi:hypothetical protein
VFTESKLPNAPIISSQFGDVGYEAETSIVLGGGACFEYCAQDMQAAFS